MSSFHVSFLISPLTLHTSLFTSSRAIQPISLHIWVSLSSLLSSSTRDYGFFRIQHVPEISFSANFLSCSSHSSLVFFPAPLFKHIHPQFHTPSIHPCQSGPTSLETRPCPPLGGLQGGLRRYVPASLHMPLYLRGSLPFWGHQAANIRRGHVSRLPVRKSSRLTPNITTTPQPHLFFFCLFTLLSF